MRNRALLHLNKIVEFSHWASGQGYVNEPTKDLYEVLRLRKGNEAPIIFHQKDRAKEHVTTWGKGIPLVRRWIRGRNDG